MIMVSRQISPYLVAIGEKRNDIAFMYHYFLLSNQISQSGIVYRWHYFSYLSTSQVFYSPIHIIRFPFLF